jgi:hypothetical protein
MRLQMPRKRAVSIPSATVVGQRAVQVPYFNGLLQPAKEPLDDAVGLRAPDAGADRP